MSVLRGALHGFTKLFADRYARDNIRMNDLLPGFCENVNFTARSLRDIPMARPARFDEIASACVFLASDASSYMTGQNLWSMAAPTEQFADHAVLTECRIQLKFTRKL